MLRLPGAALAMTISGGNSVAAASGENPLAGVSSYFTGSDRSRWITGAQQFGAVRVKSVQPGVDIVYHSGAAREIEYDFVLAPHARADRLKLRFEGARRLSIDREGNLVIATAAGDVVQHRPVAWQEQDGRRAAVSARYLISRSREARIELGQYDRSRAVTIDPVLSYSTYLGGSAADSINAIAVDSLGNAYVTGETSSADFPTTTGALRTTYSAVNNLAFVAKINSTGTALLYSTFLGGSYGDWGSAIAVDSSGNAYITGIANSSDFPTTSGAMQRQFHGSSDAFVSKLNASGTALVYSTFLGGSSTDAGSAIAIDAAGDAFIAGYTSSIDFPATSGAFSTVKSAGYSSDAFVAKVNPAGSALVFATYLGGSNSDSANAIAIDSSGNSYVTGNTSSLNFPVSTGAFQAVSKTGSYNGTAFVTALNAAGSALIYSTYLGGSQYETGTGIAVDLNREAYVTGSTGSADFPTTAGAFSRVGVNLYQYSTDAFVAKFSSTGALLASTLLGGSSYDTSAAIALDGNSNVLVTGQTTSSDFPVTPGSFPRAALAAAFLTKLTGNLSSLTYSTLFGASGGVSGTGIAVDSANNVYIAGQTASKNLPISPFAPQSNNPDAGINNSGFVTKFDLNSPTACNLSLSSYNYTAPLGGGSSSFQVSVPEGCPWEAVDTDSWLALNNPVHGIGNGTVSFTAAPNTYGNAQSTVISVGSSSFTVTQPGDSCSNLGVSPTGVALDQNGGLEMISVKLPSACQYSVTTATPWIAITSGASGSGNGTIQYYVARNDFASRSGSILVNGTSIPVSQTGGSCTASLSSSSVSFPAAGGTSFIPLTTSSSCQWSAYAIDSWLRVTVSSGTGSLNIGFAASPNPGEALRSGKLYVAGQYFTVNQAGGVPSAPSSYTISTIAGTGSYGFSGDGGPAIAAQLGYPGGLAFDGYGNLYVADPSNYRIRKVDTNGVITTFAGTGTSGFSGDNGPATSANINYDFYLATDSATNLFFSDSGNERVRKVSSGIISTVAGTGSAGSSGDGGAATSAYVNYPNGIVFDTQGNWYFADSQNNRIRKVTTGGVISTFAGTGLTGSTGDGGPASAATFTNLGSLAIDGANNIYVVDGSRVRKISGGSISNFAGGGTSTADGVPATSASLSPSAIVTDLSGNLLIATGSFVRRVTPDGNITTIAGTNTCCNSGEGIPATQAYFGNPNGIAIDPFGHVAISDDYNNRVRLLTPVSNFCTFNAGASPLAAPLAGGQLTISLSGAAGCAWNAFSNSSWINIASALSGTGNASVILNVAANSSSARTGSVNIAGININISQPGTSSSVPAKIGVFQSGAWALDANGNGQWDGAAGGDKYFAFQAGAGDVAVVGDWTGDGHAKAGIYHNGYWLLDMNNNGVWDGPVVDRFIALGGSGPGEIPVVGDWNGDGRAKVGFYYRGFWGLDYNGNGQWDGPAGGDRFIALGGNPGEVPVVGDWNGDGRTKIGIFVNGMWALDYNGNGVWDGPYSGDKYYAFSAGPGDKPVVGDWNGTRTAKIGVYHNGFWLLDVNGNGQWDGPGTDSFIALGGNPGETPIVGDWNGDGRCKVGFYTNGFWALDYNGNGRWDGPSGGDRFAALGGAPNEQPVVGKW